MIQKPIGPPFEQDQRNHLGCRPSVFEWGYSLYLIRIRASVLELYN